MEKKHNEMHINNTPFVHLYIHIIHAPNALLQHDKNFTHNAAFMYVLANQRQTYIRENWKMLLVGNANRREEFIANPHCTLSYPQTKNQEHTRRQQSQHGLQVVRSNSPIGFSIEATSSMHGEGQLSCNSRCSSFTLVKRITFAFAFNYHSIQAFEQYLRKRLT